MASGTITSKGQVTVPKEIRDYLKLATGSQVDFVIDSEGTVILLPRQIPSSTISGMMHRPGMKAVAVEEMDKAILNVVAEEQFL
jgi:AbrB family looped-hinge helix DNA binding protein